MARLVLQQLLMGALLHYLAAIQHHDTVGMAHCTQAVGDDDDGAATADGLHVLLDDAFGLVIQGTGGLVEDQDARIGEQGAGDGDALALTTGEAGAMLAHLRVIPFRQLEDKLVGARHFGRLHHPLQRRARIGQGYVLPYGAVKQQVLLQHHPYLAAQRGGIHHAQIDAVDQHPSLLGHIEALHQTGQGALARAGTPHHANHLARRYGQIDLPEHRIGIGTVAKLHVIKADPPLQTRQGELLTIGFGGGVEDIAQALYRDAGLLEVGPELGQPHHGLGHLSGQHVKGDKLADAQLGVDHQPGTKPEGRHRHQLAHQGHPGTGQGAQGAGLEAGRNIACQLLVPLAGHLGLDRHGF